MVSRAPAPAGLKLRIDSDPAQLGRTRRAVEALAARCGFTRTAVEEIGLCVNEALANVMRHAYRGHVGRPILVEAQFDPADGGALRVELRDWGGGWNPAERLAQADDYDPLTPGGLGLLCIGRLMHEVVFCPQRDGMVLKMVRRR